MTITERQKQLILAVNDNKPLRDGGISDEVFLAEYPMTDNSVCEFVTNILQDVFNGKNSEEVEFADLLSVHFGMPYDTKKIFIKLLAAPWHYWHDEIIRTLEFQESWKDEETIDALYQASISNFEYLSDDREDGIYRLNWNAMHALGKMKHPYAIEKLYILAHNNIADLSEKAIHLFEKYKLPLELAILTKRTSVAKEILYRLAQSDINAIKNNALEVIHDFKL